MPNEALRDSVEAATTHNAHVRAILAAALDYQDSNGGCTVDAVEEALAEWVELGYEDTEGRVTADLYAIAERIDASTGE